MATVRNMLLSLLNLFDFHEFSELFFCNLLLTCSLTLDPYDDMQSGDLNSGQEANAMCYVKCDNYLFIYFLLRRN